MRRECIIYREVIMEEQRSKGQSREVSIEAEKLIFTLPPPLLLKCC
jgi:hypothetical protein